MSILERPITVLKMGMRQHEAILAPLAGSLTEVMTKYDWTCHRCGVRVEGYMQLDHTEGHGNTKLETLRPICPFCHDQDHLFWAAARKRIIPIYAPRLTNEQISRIAWALAALQSADENEDVRNAIDNLTGAFRHRHHEFTVRYGSGDADSAIEAAFRFLIKEEGETDREAAMKRKIVERFEAETRFIPKFLSGAITQDPSEALSVWGLGGFMEPVRSPTEAIGLDVDPVTLISAVSSLLSE